MKSPGHLWARMILSLEGTSGTMGWHLATDRAVVPHDGIAGPNIFSSQVIVFNRTSPWAAPSCDCSIHEGRVQKWTARRRRVDSRVDTWLASSEPQTTASSMPEQRSRESIRHDYAGSVRPIVRSHVEPRILACPNHRRPLERLHHDLPSHRASLSPWANQDSRSAPPARRTRRPETLRSRIRFRPQVGLLEQRALLSALPTLTAISASALSGEPTFTATVSDFSAGGATPTAGQSPSATRMERSAPRRWSTAWRRSQPRAWRRARSPSRPPTAAPRTSPRAPRARS